MNNRIVAKELVRIARQIVGGSGTDLGLPSFCNPVKFVYEAARQGGYVRVYIYVGFPQEKKDTPEFEKVMKAIGDRLQKDVAKVSRENSRQSQPRQTSEVYPREADTWFSKSGFDNYRGSCCVANQSITSMINGKKPGTSYVIIRELQKLGYEEM